MKATWECFPVMLLTLILLDTGGSTHQSVNGIRMVATQMKA